MHQDKQDWIWSYKKNASIETENSELVFCTRCVFSCDFNFRCDGQREMYNSMENWLNRKIKINIVREEKTVLCWFQWCQFYFILFVVANAWSLCQSLLLKCYYKQVSYSRSLLAISLCDCTQYRFYWRKSILTHTHTRTQHFLVSTCLSLRMKRTAHE